MPQTDPESGELSLSIYIQAGGRSSRMGQDKALLPLGAQTCIQRVLVVAGQISPDVTIVTNRPQPYQFLNRPIVSDIYPGIGPLGGIHAALHNCRSDRALILGCDLPFLSAALLCFLIAQTGGVDAVVPKDADGRLQPLCALYARRCLTAVVDLIELGETTARALFSRLKTRVVQWSEIKSLPGAELFFFDMNTPEHYQRAKALSRP